MRLVPSAEQARFSTVLHELLSGSDVATAAERWADGDPGPGRAVWARLADAGVTALAVPSRWGGLDASPVDLVVACEELGHHAVPGPVAESVAAVPALLAALPADPAAAALCDRWLPELAAGTALATLAAPPWLPYAVDAHAADLVLLASAGRPPSSRPDPPARAFALLPDRQHVGPAGVADGEAEQRPATVRHGLPGTARTSLDPTRRLFEVGAGPVLVEGPAAGRALDRARELGALACAAQLLGAGRALLDTAVEYAAQRTQFGRPIGSYQAVKHQLADVAVALEFARPLLYAAAVSLAAGSPAGFPAVDPDAARDVSAAKVACGAAAHRAARVALQVHGAVGYTREHGLGRWLTKVRALLPAWGTPSWHRARVMAALTRPQEAAWN